MKALTLAIILLIQGCGVMYGRISMYDENNGQPEVTLDNPLGTLGYRVSHGRFTYFVEHTSGIFTTEENLGLNQIGIETDLWYFTD